MSARRCKECRRLKPGSCWRCTATCARKRRYPSYATAKAALTEHHATEPTLMVYRCRVGVSEHFHLGHVSGLDLRRLLKRAEKRRRKALIAELDLSGSGPSEGDQE